MFLGETTTYQEPADTSVYSVYSTGTRTLWSAQYPGPEASQYELRMSYGGVTTTLSSETEFFLSNVLADEVAAYWTDRLRLEINTF